MISVNKIAKKVKIIQATKRDAFIIVDGATGEGKTTCAIHIAKKVDKKFKFKTGLIYGKKALENAIHNFPEGSAIIVDEGSFAFFKRDYMHKEQKELMKLFEICRYRKLCFIACIPSIWGVDTHLLKTGRVKLRIWIPKRGRALLFKPAKKAFSFDPWNQKYNEKAETKKTVRYHKDNYIGRMTFKPLTSEEYNEYEFYKQRAKDSMKQEEDVEQEEQLPKEHIEILAYEKAGLKKTEIAKLVGVSDRTIYRVLKKNKSDSVTPKQELNCNVKQEEGSMVLKDSSLT